MPLIFGWDSLIQYQACTKVYHFILLKDHYENLYAVVNGEKHFTLIPPAMYPFLCEGTFTNSNWVIDQNNEFYI
jgi:hypothetical protein